jgi:hypothetical protein
MEKKKLGFLFAAQAGFLRQQKNTYIMITKTSNQKLFV